MLKKLFLVALLATPGCSALKSDVGDYVTDAVVQKIEADVEAKLQTRGVSLAEIKSVTDANGDGKITPQEVLSVTKGFAKDFILLEAQKFVSQKMQDVPTKNDLESKSKEFWYWLITAVGTLLVGYLGKQVASAKADGHRDRRIAIVEKLLGVADPSPATNSVSPRDTNGTNNPTT